MSCTDWEQDLALSVSGDLSADRLAEVQAHLSVCAACRVKHTEYVELHRSLREWGQTPVPEFTVAAVRIGVRRQLLRQRVVRWSSAAAIALTMAGGAWWRAAMTQPVEQLRIAVASPVAPAVSPTRVVQPAVHHAPPIRAPRPPVERPGVKSVDLSDAVGDQVQIRMATTDPNVVILWLADKEKSDEANDVGTVAPE